MTQYTEAIGTLRSATAQYTEAIGTLRSATDADPLTREGLAVPYGQVAANTDIGPEVFLPGAFARDAASWAARQDGARLPFKSKHGGPVVGTSTVEDTPDGLRFRASFFDRPEARAYLEEVDAGLNGVSIEFVGTGKPSRTKGITAHRDARILAIAGSLTPAYDGARISLRDMEDEDVDEDEITQDRDAAPAPTTETPVAERAAAELASVADIRPRITVTRPEAVYGRDAALPNGERPNMILDGYRAWQGDSAAMERQTRHYAHLADIAGQMERAGEVLVAEIPGMYPNEYMPGLLVQRILKGRPMGGFFRNVPISDARPRVYAKVTTSGAVVTAADGVAFTATDVETTAVTVTPAIYAGYTDVSRAALDGGDPNTANMIYADLIEGYVQASETVIKTAVEAGSTASGTAITAATPFAGVLGNIITYYGTRFRPAEGAFIPSALYSVLLAEADSAGRPKMPLLNPTNSDGAVAPGGIRGQVLDATTFLSYASTTNVCVFARPEDHVVFESPIVRFNFEQSVGTPARVRIGVWAYLGVGARLGGLKVTAA